MKRKMMGTASVAMAAAALAMPAGASAQVGDTDMSCGSLSQCGYFVVDTVVDAYGTAMQEVVNAIRNLCNLGEPGSCTDIGE